MKPCGQCARELVDDAVYCSYCGVKLEERAAEAPQQAGIPAAAPQQPAASQPQQAGVLPAAPQQQAAQQQGDPAAAQPQQPYPPQGHAPPQGGYPQPAQPPYPQQQAYPAPQQAYPQQPAPAQNYQYGSTQASDLGADGLGARTWSGGQITTPNGITEVVVMQSKAQYSSLHIVSLQDGNFVLTPTRIIWYKHGGVKKFLLGDFSHLTQGTYDFEIPLSFIHSIEVDSIGLWKYERVHTYDGEMFSFCFNAMNHTNFTNHIHALVPGLLSVPRRITADYYPNISPLDPRNPFGERYDHTFPRPYVVADNQQPESLPAAVADAKRAGILPEAFELPGVPMAEQVIPQGIPCVVHYKINGQGEPQAQPGQMPPETGQEGYQ